MEKTLETLNWAEEQRMEAFFQKELKTLSNFEGLPQKGGGRKE